MSDGNRKPDSTPPDPDEVARMLDLELMQKRSSWKQRESRYAGLRMASYLFLFLIIMGGVLAFVMLPPRAAEQAPTPAPVAGPEPSLTPSRSPR